MKLKALTNHVFRDHVLIGGIFALFLMPWLGKTGSFLFWMSTVFVDLDHYIHYLSCTGLKHPGIGSMFRFHEELFSRRNRPELYILEIFHTVEFLFLLGLLAFAWVEILIPVFWGVVFHMAVDVVHLSRHGILDKRPNSFLEYVWRKRKMLKDGLNPDDLIRETLKAAGLE